MHFLDEKLRKIWLHDSSIKSVSCDRSEIILTFEKGFRDSNHNLKSNCQLLICINNLNTQNVNCFVDIKVLNRFRRYVRFDSFVKMLQKSDFVVEVEYYSEFERALLLIGQLGDADILLKISDIEKISFQYDD